MFSTPETIESREFGLADESAGTGAKWAFLAKPYLSELANSLKKLN
jgi:hypothetical protein